jgi:hypothetical protein
MAEGAQDAVGVPPGVPVVPIAPPEVIMDEADLAEARDALREGRRITFASDGKVYVENPPSSPPMSEAAETFIESKLGEVRRWVLQGGGVSISPDGSIAGSAANHRLKYAAGPDVAFDEQELVLVHSGIMSGARIGILPDGTIHYLDSMNDREPTPDEIRHMRAVFDEAVRSGAIARELAAGKAVRVLGDRIEVVDAPAQTQGFPFPEDAPPVLVPPRFDAEDIDLLTLDTTNAADVDRHADALAARATELRDTMANHLQDETLRLGSERDTFARRQWGAEQEAAAAKQQVLRETRIATETRAEIDRLETKAGDLEKVGNTAAGAELREQARLLLGREAAAKQRAAAANEEITRLQTEAAEHGAKVKELEAKLADVQRNTDAGEKAIDALEAQSRLLDTAAARIADATRLDADAQRLRDAGDATGAATAQRAADDARQLGARALADARAITVDVDTIDAATGAVPAASQPAMPPIRTNPGVVDADDVTGPDGTALAFLDTEAVAGDPLDAAPVAADDGAHGDGGVDVVSGTDVMTPDDAVALDLDTSELLAGEPETMSPVDALTDETAFEPSTDELVAAEPEPLVALAEPVIEEPFVTEPDPLVALDDPLDTSSIEPEPLEMPVEDASWPDDPASLA